MLAINARSHFPPTQRPRNRGGGGRHWGHWGQLPLHFLYLGKKCPFSGMKVPCFHRIEVPYLQNLSALFWSVPPHFRGASAASAPTTQFLLFSWANFTLKLQEMAISGFENVLESIAVLRAGLINFPQPRPSLNLFNVIKISIKVVKNNSPLPSRDLGQIMLNRDDGSYLPQEYLHLVDK